MFGVIRLYAHLYTQMLYIDDMERITDHTDVVLVGLHPLPILTQRRVPLLRVTRGNHSQSWENCLTVLVLISHSLILPDCGAPFRVR